MALIFVVARTAHGRPSLQHMTADHEMTDCGLDITSWSRAYQSAAIKEILCKKCNRGVKR